MGNRVVWVSFDVIGRACLEVTAESGAEIVGVATLPGPVDPNRSGQCAFDVVAGRLGASLLETKDANGAEMLAWLAERHADMVFVVGWSQLVRQPFIDLAPEGVYGMHPTLLPRHRGRAPIPWAILSGLATTGVTLFQIVDPTADSGPIIGQVDVPIEHDETAGTLYDKLFDAHLDLLRRCVPMMLDGTAPRIAQDDRRGSSWLKRTPADGIIDWETRSPYLYDWVRAQTRPYPGAFTFLGDEKLIVWRVEPVGSERRGAAGVVTGVTPQGIVVACGDGSVLLREVQLEGGDVLEGDAIANLIPIGARLG